MLKRKRGRWILAAVVIALLAYWGWRELTRTRGSQAVRFAAAEKSCGSSGALRYCLYRDPRGTNGDLLYHLPGRNLDEQVWNDDTYYTALLQAEWQRSGVLPPAVVTVSYGPTWLLAPKGEKAESGLLEDFFSRLPQIERRVGAPRRRMLLGESMGGLNVLIAGLSRPELFDKVAALCPGVYTVSPFSTLSEMRAGMERTGASPKMIYGVWTLARRYFANDAEWRRASPLTLVEKVGPTAPALYLSNGLYDSYGNFEGTERLARRAAERSIATEWHPLYGGHCANDARSLAAFLATSPQQ